MRLLGSPFYIFLLRQFFLTLPPELSVVIVFFLAQRMFIAGITLTGLKG